MSAPAGLQAAAEGPLAGIRVIDVTRVVSGPFATMQLADLGAEVIKIEAPGTGDDSRAFGPPFVGGESAYFLAVNRNKKSLALDLKHPRSHEVVRALVATADVFVENFRPGTADRLGIGYEALSAINPRLVYAAISGFGRTGPERDRPGYDLVVQGEGGLMDITGEPDGPPTKVGCPVADLVSGLYAAQGILAALRVRDATGRGQRVDVAMIDAVASLLTYNAGGWFATGESPRRRGNRHPTIVPYAPFEAADGWINLGIANDAIWRRFCKVAGRSDLAEHPSFAAAPDRVRNAAELVPIVEAIVAARSRDEWVGLLDPDRRRGADRTGRHRPRQGAPTAPPHRRRGRRRGQPRRAFGEPHGCPLRAASPRRARPRDPVGVRRPFRRGDRRPRRLRGGRAPRGRRHAGLKGRGAMDEAAARAAFEAALERHAPGFGTFFLARLLDLDISYPDGPEPVCEIAFPVRDFAFNPQGSLHGGVVAIVLDIAQGHLIHHAMGGAGATLEFKIQFLAPVRGPNALARGRFLRRGRSVCFMESRLHDAGAAEPAAISTATWRAPRPAAG